MHDLMIYSLVIVTNATAIGMLFEAIRTALREKGSSPALGPS